MDAEDDGNTPEADEIPSATQDSDDEPDYPPNYIDEDDLDGFDDFNFVPEVREDESRPQTAESENRPENYEDLILADYVSESSKPPSSRSDGKRIAYQQRIAMIHERATVDKVDGSVLQGQYAVDKLRNQLKESNDKLRKLEYEEKICECEINDAQQKGQNVIVDRLKDKMKRISDEIDAETLLKNRIQANLDSAEYAWCETLVQQGHYALMSDALKKKEEKYGRQKMQDALQRKRKELISTHQAVKEVIDNRRGVEQRAVQKITQAERQLDEARAARRTVNQFINKTISDLREEKQKEQEKMRQELSTRISSVLTLKRDITRVRDNLSVQQAREHALVKQYDDEELQRARELEAAGRSPSVELLIEQRRGDIDFEREVFEENRRQKQVAIMERILQEERADKKRRIMYPHLYRDTRSVQPEHFVAPHYRKPLKTFEELKAQIDRTEVELNGSELRGPTSTFDDPRFAESDSDEAPTNDELTGTVTGTEASERRARRRNRKQAEQAELTKPEIQGFWKSYLRKEPNKKPADDVESIASSASGMSDEEANERLLEDLEEDDSERERKANERRRKKMRLRKAKQSVKESKMQQEIMQRVLEQHRAGITRQQVAAGRKFEGCAFESKPRVAHFKDFVIDNTYKMKLVITNVSYTINSIKLVDYTERLKDFIKLEFDPPGQMGAGMSCEMLVTFTPRINVDLEGEIKLQAITGPVSIPIKCTTKKCILSLDTDVDFGITVIGETVRRKIVLKNAGALPSKVSYGKRDLMRRSPAGATTVRIVAPGDSLSQQPQSPPQDKTVVADDAQPSPVDEMEFGEVTGDSVGPFGSVTFELVWRPTVPGKCTTDFMVTATECPGLQLVCRAVGEALDVPVWVPRRTVDLQICVLDRLFQDTVYIHSRAKTALKMQFELPKAVGPYLEILPRTGYIQAESQFPVQLKFLPRRSLLDDSGNPENSIAKYFDSKTSTFEVPVIIRVAGQTYPVEFSVHAFVTNSDMSVDLSEIDFAHCTIYESVRKRIRLRNHSVLPQKFGFTNVPDYCQVQPNDGFGTLLPQETLELELVFSPPKAADYDFEIVCKNLFNREVRIHCVGVGVHPPLLFDSQVVQFRATALYDTAVAHVNVRNDHVNMNEFKQPVPRIGSGPIAPVTKTSFEFVVPNESGCPITIYPLVGTVLPGKSQQIQIFYTPTLSDGKIRSEAASDKRKDAEKRRELELKAREAAMAAEADNDKGTDKKKKSDASATNAKRISATPKKKGGQQEPAIDDFEALIASITPESIDPKADEYFASRSKLQRNFNGEFNVYKIPCYVTSSTIEPEEKPSPDAPTEYTVHNTIYLEVRCPAIKPHLVVVSGSGRPSIDLGSVMLGQRIIKPITIQNIHNEVLNLELMPLDPNGTFQVLNAMRPLQPDGTFTMMLCFAPQAAAIYQQVLRVKTQYSCLNIVILAQSTPPYLNVSAESVFDMGTLIQGEFLERPFKVENKSTFAIEFKLLLESQRPEKERSKRLRFGVQNFNGSCVFDCVPRHGRIEPGQVRDITVTFAPDHSSELFADGLTIELGGCTETHQIQLVGQAKPNLTYVTGGDPTMPDFESLALVRPLPSAILLDDPDHKKATGIPEAPLPTIPPSLTPSSIYLTINSILNDSQTYETVPREFVVGCCRSMQSGQKKNGEFSFDSVPQLQQLGFTVDPQKGSLEPGTRKSIMVSWTPPSGHDLNAVVETVATMTLKGSVTEQVRVLLRAFVVLSNKPKSAGTQRSDTTRGHTPRARATPAH